VDFQQYDYSLDLWSYGAMLAGMVGTGGMPDNNCVGLSINSFAYVLDLSKGTLLQWTR
jgi:hypothetical protein